MDKNIFFKLMPLPGTNDASIGMFDKIKSFDIDKLEIVDEAHCAALVDEVATTDYFWCLWHMLLWKADDADQADIRR